MMLCKQCALNNHEGCTQKLYYGERGERNPPCECLCEWSSGVGRQDAKDRLEAAIRAYHAEVSPDEVVGDWVLITHRDSVEMSANNQTVVGVLAPTGQYSHRTTGLLTEALKNR